MKTIECPSCAVEIDAGNDVCPICGYDLPEQKGWVGTVVWMMIILMLLWMLL